MEPQMSEIIGKEDTPLAAANEEAAQTSASQGAVPTPGKALRGRGACRSKTEVSNSSNKNGAANTPASGRVLRDRSTRTLPAWRLHEASEDTEETGRDTDSNRRRKPANPRRRRSTTAASGVEVVSETGDHSRPATGEDGDKDSSATRGPRSKRGQNQGRSKAASTRQTGASPRMVCKSEPDADTPSIGDKSTAKRAVAKEVKENDVSSEEAQVPGEEEPTLQTDSQPDKNKQHQSGEEEVLSSDEDVPFRDDLNDQSYDPKAERDTHKPRRKSAPRSKEKKEKAPSREREPEIKTEGGEGDEGGDVKLENEFGEEAEAPRKRGRRRKDDKSPRLPKRRKKPPVQYVRCEMEGCGTVLAHPRYLQHHIKYQHLLKKKYVCPHPSCGRLFRLQKQLLRHAKHHTDQRDYICEFCARAFKSSHNLAVHRMIHTGEKPLQCEICGFTCRQKASLNWHMKKHDADAFYQFSCGICGKKFEKKDSVVAHKAKSHPEVLIAEALAANAGALITTPGALLEASSSSNAVVSTVEQQQQQLSQQLQQQLPPDTQVVVVEDAQTLHTMQVPVTLALQTATEEEDDNGGGVIVQEQQISAQHTAQPSLTHTHTLQMPLQFVSAVAGSQAPQIHQLTLHSGQHLVAHQQQKQQHHQQPQQITLQAFSPQMQTQILHMTFQPVAAHTVPGQQQTAHIQGLPLLSATPQHQQLTLQAIAQHQEPPQPSQTLQQQQQEPQDLPGHHPAATPALLTHTVVVQEVEDPTTDCQEALGFGHDHDQAAPPSSSSSPPPPDPPAIDAPEPVDTAVVWQAAENGEGEGEGEGEGDIEGVWERGAEEGGGAVAVLTHGSEGQVQHGLM
ncbi:E3 ubiquitin-protein ligase ZFP91 isoform X2 [Engraulis encrasicolus]|uniref:E3 ubiquitin-protein ligase ZFP91 isoform X2 n=1 Tax=Engraulis encrasicolus TaxID=184585 RepID=UPI002FCEA0EC